MSLLDQAKRLAERGFTPWPNEVMDPDDATLICELCHRVVKTIGLGNHWTGHAPDCPWPAMLKIVKALEAAERVAELIPGFLLDHHECDGSEWCVMVRGQHHVWYCDGCDEMVSCDCDTHEDGLRGAHLRAWARLVHDDGCPFGALAAALRGDPIARTAPVSMRS